MSNLALLLLTAAASLLAASAVSLVPTTCDACRTVVEEYFQRYMEAAHEHRRHGLALNRAGPRTWWNKAETKPVESDVSFEKRLEVTCDASRLGMYKPLIRQTCEEILLHPASGVNHKLTHLYSTNETYHPELKLGPGRRMHVWRVAGMKWHVCTQLFDHCDENTLGHRTTLTDRCGMCHNLAVDLLYLVRRGEPGPDVTRFFESMVADLCLSTELRHSRGQQMRVNTLCELNVPPHEAAIVELLKDYSTGAHRDADDKDFSEAMCGPAIVGLCKLGHEGQ